MKSLEIEALTALVGEAQVDPKAALGLLDETGAVADDCQDGPTKGLWRAVVKRLRGGEPLDAVTLCETSHMPRTDVLRILTEAPLGVARERLMLLRERSLRRQYVEALRVVAGLAKDDTQPLAHAVSAAQKLLGQWQAENQHVRPLDSTVMGLVDDLEAAQAGTREPTLRTGLEAWDAVCGGLPPTLTVIGALPGCGKSALVAGLVRNLAKAGTCVGLLSLEDERDWVAQRLVSEASGVPLFLLANRPLTQYQLERAGEAAASVHAYLGRVLCDDRGGLTTAEVVASARQMIARGAKAVLVDHLGEIRLTRSDRHDLDVAEALSDLRLLAKTHRVPVVVVAHLRRREGLGLCDEPRLTDFAFSAGVERMARLAVGLFRREGPDGQIEGDSLLCTVLKQTKGASGLAFELRLSKASAVVVDSPAPEAARNLYGGDQ